MLFHRSVYWHDSFDAQSLILIKSVERLSNHLWEHIELSKKARYDIDAKTLYHIVKSIESCEPFEVEVVDNKVVKCVVRVKYDDNRDISIVVREGFILTAWLNDSTDLHFTLDKSKYTTRYTSI